MLGSFYFFLFIFLMNETDCFKKRFKLERNVISGTFMLYTPVCTRVSKRVFLIVLSSDRVNVVSRESVRFGSRHRHTDAKSAEIIPESSIFVAWFLHESAGF